MARYFIDLGSHKETCGHRNTHSRNRTDDTYPPSGNNCCRVPPQAGLGADVGLLERDRHFKAFARCCCCCCCITLTLVKSLESVVTQGAGVLAGFEKPNEIKVRPGHTAFSRLKCTIRRRRTSEMIQCAN